MVRQGCSFVAVALWLAMGAASGQAAAHPPLFIDAASEDKADELRKQGNTLSREGRLPEAIDAYKASFRLSETFAVAANLGNLELRLQRYRDAAEHLAFAIRLAPDDATPAVVDALRKGLAEAQQHVGALRIRVGVDYAEVTVDGLDVDWLDVAHDVFVEPGSHTVAAARAGYAAGRKTIEVTAGAHVEVELALSPLASSAPGTPAPPVASPQADEGKSIRLPIIVAGASAATVGAVLGVVFTVLANGKSSQTATLGNELRARAGAAACDHPSAANAAECSRLQSLFGGQSTFRNAAIGSFVAGGALALGTGAYALWPTLSGRSTSGSRVRALPSVGARFGGVMVEGEF